MKFEELSILKYGALVDFKPISFSSNINVLLGANGSGKSSIVKSLYHLLFGIPTKSDHPFQYDYDGTTVALRTGLGAGDVILNVDNNGDKISISRSKWNKNINEQIKDIYPQLDDVEKLRRVFSNFFFTSTKMITDIQSSINKDKDKTTISLDNNIRTDLIQLISIASGSMSQNVEEAVMSYAEHATKLTDKTESATRTKNLTKIGELQNNLKDVNERLKELEKTEKENIDNLSKNDEEDIAKLKKDIVGLNTKISELESAKTELQIQQKHIENIGELLDSLNSLQKKNIKINAYKTHKLVKIQSDYKNLNESTSVLEVARNNLVDLKFQIDECDERIGGVNKATLKELELDTYLTAFDDYENTNEQVLLQIDEVKSLETTLTEIVEELNLTKTSVAYYKKTKLKESDKNKILKISEKINEYDLQPLVDEIEELKKDIQNKKQEIKDSKDGCGFSPQTIAQLKKEKITAKDKTLLKKLNQEILDIKQNANETKKKLKRFNEDKASTQPIDYRGDDIFSITEAIQSILEENQKTFKTVHKSYKDIKKLEDLLNSIIENEILIMSKVSLIHDDYENLVENLTAKLQVQSIEEEIKVLKLKEKTYTSNVKDILKIHETILKKYKLGEATLKDSDFSYYFDELDDLIDLEEELNTLNDSKSKLENELNKKKEDFSGIKKAYDTLIQKFKVSKSFMESEDLDEQLDLLVDLNTYTLKLKEQNLELSSLNTDLNSKKKSLKKLLEPINKDLEIEEIEETSLESHIENFNNSISKLEEDFENKKTLAEAIKEAKKTITDAEKIQNNILSTYDAESLDEIESVILVLDQLETLFDDNELNFFKKSEKDRFANKILSSELTGDTLLVNSNEIDDELEVAISKIEDQKLELSRLESAFITEPDYKKEDLLSEKYKILREWQEARKQYLSTVLALYLVDEQLKNTANITLDLKKRINSIINKINPNLAGVVFDEEDDILSVKYQVSKENTRDKELHLHSDGEQAAIALAIRMAVQLETFKNSDFRFPLFYDDISDHLDRDSQAGFIKVLEDLATETQIVVLTHDEVFAEALSKSSKDVNLIDLNAS
jgi:DNA repair exonuclease SbcCD ATPase subunit